MLRKRPQLSGKHQRGNNTAKCIDMQRCGEERSGKSQDAVIEQGVRKARNTVWRQTYIWGSEDAGQNYQGLHTDQADEDGAVSRDLDKMNGRWKG